MEQKHTATPAQNKRRLPAVFGLTAVYLLAAKVISRGLTRGLVLLADVGPGLTDMAGLALLAIFFAERPATLEHTYGYYRIEILAALYGSARHPGRRWWRS